MARADVQLPNFDPLDGGVAAECLFLLEAPGPQAIASGFVSRDNPDETAKNWFELNRDAGLPRERTLMWNIIPWYLGNGRTIRAATGQDIGIGVPHLVTLIGLLPNLRLLVLVGRKAAHSRRLIDKAAPHLMIFEAPHPSPKFVNRAPGNRQFLLDRLIEVRRVLCREWV